MSYFHAQNARLAGISCCVPENVTENSDYKLFSAEDLAGFIAKTGVERRRMANIQTTTADLCYYAAEQIIRDLGWNKEEIDCLIFVSQTPDYKLPATSCILQNRLNLSEECYSLDISSGCSGWIYGTSVMTSLMQNGHFKKGLLLVGDTALKFCSYNDRSTWPLFGDAGTASAFEFENGNEGFRFHMATDGSGYEAIMIPEGGYRAQCDTLSLAEKTVEDGISRNGLQLILNGMDVFSFGITKAPETVNKLCQYYQIEKEDIDAFIFHQANLFMNEKIRKKLSIPENKVPYTLKNFGNTSSASIPLTLKMALSGTEFSNCHNIIACGFGVGLSWGSVFFRLDNFIHSELIEI